MAELSLTTENGETRAEVSGHQNTKNIDKIYILYILYQKTCFYMYIRMYRLEVKTKTK